MDVVHYHLYEWIAAYRYLIIFPLAIVEGPVLMAFCGILLRLGMFTFWPLYLVLMAGDFVADILWYAVGYYGGMHFLHRFGRFFGASEDLVRKAVEKFRHHEEKILFISKITMGFGFALVTLIGAGAAKVPIKKYMILNGLGGFVWTGFLIFVGYAFGNLFAVIDTSFRAVSIGAFVVFALLVLWGFNKYLREKFHYYK